VNVFARLAPRLQQAIVSRLGWSSLRPVQETGGYGAAGWEQRGHPGADAGGKDRSCDVPHAVDVVEHEPPAWGGLYVAPIKALLNNQSERLGMYTEMVRTAPVRMARRYVQPRAAEVHRRPGRVADDHARIAGGHADFAPSRCSQAV